MTTLGFATIVTQVALAWQSVTGGGIGLSGPPCPPPFDTAWGFYLLCLGFAAVVTWMTANIAASRYGRSLDRHPRRRGRRRGHRHFQGAPADPVFLFSGFTAGVAGGLFATLQSYITPDAFSFDLSVTVLHRHPGRRPRLHPRPADRQRPADPAAGIRRPAGRLVHLPLRRAAAGDRAADARRHRRPAGFPQPQAAGKPPRPSCPGPTACRRCWTTAAVRDDIVLRNVVLALRRRPRDRRPGPDDPRRRRCMA